MNTAKLKLILFKKNLGLIVFVLALALSLFLIFAVIIPNIQAQRKIFDEKKQQVQKKDVLEKTLANLKTIDPIKEQERLSIIQQLIPDKNDFLKSLSFIEFLAQRANVSVLSNRAISLSPGSGDQTAQSGFLIQSTFEGDYTSLKSLLSTIYETKRAIGVTTLIFSGQSDDTKIVLNATFFFPIASDKAKLVSLDAPVSTFSKEEEQVITGLNSRSIVPVSSASASFGRQNPFSR